MKTIVLTGGHHNSALVVAQELVKRGYKVAWFGHRFATQSDQHDSAEYLEVSESNIPFYELYAGKLSSPLRLGELLKIPVGLLHALWLLRKLRPNAVVSFGSYLGAATAFAAFLLRIPVYLHEQSIIAGKANLLAARWAQKIYLTWNASRRYFLSNQTEVVGLPLRPGLLRTSFNKLFQNSRPTILILGGKQGSHVINQEIFSTLSILTKKYNILHQTGTNTVTGDYGTSLKFSSAHYRPYGYISQDEIGRFYANANLVISRAGAHTSYELAILGKRAILIPFEYTTGTEQLEHARLLSAAGIATLLREKDLTKKTLLSAIKHSLQLPPPTPLSLPRDATKLMVDSLTSNL